MTAGAARAPYLERLAARSATSGTVLCLGIDPDPGALPPGFPPNVAGVERFARLLVEAAAPQAAAVKPNLAFFEAFGSAGIAALERIRAAVPDGVPVIADAKRGDIGSTAARQAAALYDALGADAITVNPYLGEEAVRPGRRELPAEALVRDPAGERRQARACGPLGNQARELASPAVPPQPALRIAELVRRVVGGDGDDG